MRKGLREKNLLLYGADVNKWPDKLRSQMKELMARDLKVAAWIHQELLLESRMKKDAGLIDNPDLPGQIVAQVMSEKHEQANEQIFVEQDIIQPSYMNLVFASLAVIGFALGFTSVQSKSQDVIAGFETVIYDDNEVL